MLMVERYGLLLGSGSERRIYMEVFVKLEAYDTLIDREQVMRTRQVGGRQMQQMLESGKVKASGMFADAQGASSSSMWTLRRNSSTCWLR